MIELCVMRRTLSAMELRQSLGEVLDRVALLRDEYVIERKGRPMAALVPVELLDQIRRAARLNLLETLERRPSRISQKAADVLADEAKHATRPRARRRS